MPDSNVVRVGALSIRITRDEKERLLFYDRLLGACERFLPGCRCDIVLLPERSSVRPDQHQPLDGPVCRQFQALARQHRLWLIAPLAETDGKVTYNTQVVISPAGQVIHAYRKVHLAPGEEKDTQAGNCFEAFDLPWFRAGVTICYDHHFPESSRCLAVQGAQVIFWPAYGDLRRPERNTTRCVDNNIYLVAAGVIDMACNLPAEAFSRGLVMNPAGQVLVQAAPEDSLVAADLPLDPKTGRLQPWSAPDQYLSRRLPGCYTALTQ